MWRRREPGLTFQSAPLTGARGDATGYVVARYAVGFNPLP